MLCIDYGSWQDLYFCIQVFMMFTNKLCQIIERHCSELQMWSILADELKYTLRETLLYKIFFISFIWEFQCFSFITICQTLFEYIYWSARSFIIFYFHYHICDTLYPTKYKISLYLPSPCFSSVRLILQVIPSMCGRCQGANEMLLYLWYKLAWSAGKALPCGWLGKMQLYLLKGWRCQMFV